MSLRQAADAALLGALALTGCAPLPDARGGSYQEYTVATPWEDDREARRIVAADDGGRFYTDDHYDSFTEVVSG